MDNPHPISIGGLVNGLVADLRRLLTQEICLVQHEMQLEVRKVALGLLHAALGIILSLAAVTFFLLTMVHLLQTYTTLPLWACYGVVGVICAAIGGILFYSLLKLGATLRLWPFRTVHSIKEDARWIKEQVLSTKT